MYRNYRLLSNSLPPRPGQQSELAPLPVTVDVGEADLAQPVELRLEIQQLIGRVLLFGRDSERIEEPAMQAIGRRRHVLEIAEDAACTQPAADLRVHRSLASVTEMMNRDARDDRIETTERAPERTFEIGRHHV